MGVIGGQLGYRLLKRIGGSPLRRNLCSSEAYRYRSKLEVLLGPGTWAELAEGGLNGMTVRRFSRIVADSGYVVEHFEPVPIRRLKLLAAGPTRELFTAIIRCRLRAA